VDTLLKQQLAVLTGHREENVCVSGAPEPNLVGSVAGKARNTGHVTPIIPNNRAQGMQKERLPR